MVETIQANLAQGQVLGVREAEVCRFSGIPFAHAPIGQQRFRAPLPLPLQGTLDARQMGSVAPQLPSRLAKIMGDFESVQSEDCLNLTVWTPEPDRKRRPVLIWLHGGAWQSGAGALDWYSGAQLAQRGDIVVVAPNYRLGPLGWIAIPDETANLGLLDHEAAIDWTIEHVESFGGDPGNITVMGQSAGGMNIVCLLMRQPRFQRAILQSASLGRGFRSADKAAEIAETFLRAAGAANVEEARHLPVSTLLQAQRAEAVVQWLADEAAQRTLFGPVADGDVLPSQPETCLLRAAGHVDVLAGYTRDEMAAFPGFGLDAKSQAIGDQIYGVCTRQWLSDTQAQGRSAWSYHFRHRPSEAFGACHCIELPFVFGSLKAFANAPMLRELQPENARRLVDEVQRGWLAFIRHGDPGWSPWPYQHIYS